MMKFLHISSQKSQHSSIEETERGFSIIEVMVSVFIATAVLGGFATAITLSFQGYEAGEEYYRAAKISQEGMEIAINKAENHVQCSIDSDCNVISTWQGNLLGTFEIDPSKPQQRSANQTFDDFESDHYLCVRSEGNYGYCGGGEKMDENFTRKVTITSEGSDRARIVTEVSWEARNNSRTIQLEEVFFGPNTE